tara:strand:+ start:400 stop:1392 length:993 start_codon:yes stop_codon:yes gene_type:complete
MRRVVVLFLVNVFLFSCSKEFVPLLESDDQTTTSSIIGPSNDPNHKSGSLQASFLSTNSVFTVASSTLSSVAFPITFISTSENNDSLVWIFEGSTASPTTLRGNISSPSAVATRVYYRDFGRFDVVHAVANKTNIDIITKKDYVTYEFLDNLTIDSSNDDSWEVTSAESIGWIAPNADYFYEGCKDALISFHTLRDQITGNILPNNNVNHVLSKSFRSFGTKPKNLVFEYKMEFIALPTVIDSNMKVLLSYNPIIDLGSGVASSTQSASYELWSDSSYDVTNFRQVVIPLPNLTDFDLIFTKYPSVLDIENNQIHPFTVCIRGIRIVTAE